MTIDEKFPHVNYEMVKNEIDNPYTFPYFWVPEGYWYSTNYDPEVKQAKESGSVYMFGGFLKVVDPNSNPLKGRWYYWE